MSTNSDASRLTAYLLDELDQDERADVEAWLAADAEARALLEETKSVAVLLADALRADAAAPNATAGAASRAPSGLTERQRRLVLERGAAASKGSLASPGRRLGGPLAFDRRAWAALAAATVLIGVGLAATMVDLRPVYFWLYSVRSSQGHDGAARDVLPEIAPVTLADVVRGRDPMALVGGLPAGGSTPYTGMPPSLVMVAEPEAELLEGEAPEPWNTEDYDHIEDNPFRRAIDEPLSTFSIDVDTASYSNVRRFVELGKLPPAGAVRIEELINYFPYDYAPPAPDDPSPFAANVEIGPAPWKPDHKLVRIGLKGRDVAADSRPSANLVFLIDVSGSMEEPNKLPLVKEALTRLTDGLRPDDSVAIVVYAGSSGLVLPPTGGGDRSRILDAVERLESGGSTNGGEGIQLAYETARRELRDGGINRVVLATDGDFNVGVTSTDELVRLVQEGAADGIALSVLGFGMGNYNDAMLEKLADRGNGNYAYIDTAAEASKALGEQLVGTLMTIAKDVKIQVEFNPSRVEAYRLIGYENRVLANQDFNDDTKDAGEIGAGHTVTALYEVVPVGGSAGVPGVDPLRYQGARPTADAASSNELLTLKLRYKDPAADTSKLLTVLVPDDPRVLEATTDDFRFAAAVAELGMLLRRSPHAGASTADSAIELARGALGADELGYRAGFVDVAAQAAGLLREQETQVR